MNKDQIERLSALSEKIAEAFLIDADPDNWVAAGILPNLMTTQDRGDAVWCRKLAIQTGSLLARVVDLKNHDLNSSSGTQMPREETELEIKRYEKQAKELLKAISAKSA